MDLKTYYEHYNRVDPSSTYRPEHEATIAGRVAWFSGRIPAGAKVVEYGCGEGVVLGALADRLKLHPDSQGVDISEQAAAKAAARFPKLKFASLSPAGAIPSPDGFFDAVVASEVIEHVFDTDGMMKELARVLRPSGLLLLSCPYHGFLKDLGLVLTGGMDEHYHNPRSTHIRYYSKKTLARTLASHGFRPAEWGGVGRLPFLWKSILAAAVKR